MAGRSGVARSSTRKAPGACSWPPGPSRSCAGTPHRAPTPDRGLLERSVRHSLCVSFVPFIGCPHPPGLVKSRPHGWVWLLAAGWVRAVPAAGGPQASRAGSA